MMMKEMVVIAISMVIFSAGFASAEPLSPYVGQEQREIKSLSPDEVKDYLAGKGMGLAKVAELNGYPGPAHVLELASQLSLSAEQKARTQALFNDMQAKAVHFGRMLVEEERNLDKSFSLKTITPETLETSLKRIGTLQAQVRQTHLETHLAQAKILSPAQTAKYIELRGYNSTGHGGHSHNQ
jgi:Spy/CpxP family protein refolding chaperone